MKIILQRTKKAQVTVEGKTVGSIEKGMLVFLAVGKADDQADIDYLVNKLIELRIFEDENGKMNLSVGDVHGAFLVVSQFTLLGRCEKGRRPSFDEAADPQKAELLYNSFVEKLRSHGGKVETGEFRAMMDVSLVNDGPVTFILDSKAK